MAAGPLRMSATGAAAKEIQLALKTHGYPLTGTGHFGPQTDTAADDLQRNAGLPVAGVIDAATAALLDQPNSAASVAPLWLSVSLAHLGNFRSMGLKGR